MNLNRIMVLFLVLAGWAGVPTPAAAQPAEVLNLHRRILEVRRGMSMEEVAVFYQEDFAALDPDQDGRIDQQEFLNMSDIRDLKERLPPGEEHAAVFRMFSQGMHDQLDRDRDGFISVQEYLDICVPFARSIDADGDEFLSYEEVKADWDRRQRVIAEWAVLTGGGDQKSGDTEKTFNEPDARIGGLENIGAIRGGSGQ